MCATKASTDENEKGDVVGFALVILKRSESRAALMTLFVDPDYRNRRIGSELLRKAERYCVESKAHMLEISPAVKGYFSLGIKQDSYEEKFLVKRGFVEDKNSEHHPVWLKLDVISSVVF